MERQPKILLIAGGIFVFLLVVTIYLGIRLIERFVPGASTESFAELETAKVTKGADRFQKASFYTDEGLGAVTDLRKQTIGRAMPYLAIVGTKGAVFLAADKTVTRRFEFPASVAHEAIALAEPMDPAEPIFFSHGSWSAPVIVFDGSPNELWRYGGSPGVDDAASGDLYGDGKIEIVVGMNGSGGIHLLDINGHEIWSRSDGNVWHVEILGGSNGSPGRILNSNASGQLVIRNSQGEVITRQELDLYLSNFSLVRWGDETEPTHIVAADKSTVYVYTSTGERVAGFDAPAPSLYYDLRAITVHFSAKAADFAAVRYYGRPKHSLLTINGPDGSLVYREILADECDSLAAIPDAGGEKLLLGCRDHVLEYTPVGSGTP